MDTKQATEILERYNRRERIKQAIAANFEAGSGKTRRGVVANTVAYELGLTINASFHQELKQILLSMGFRSITVQGKFYWGELVLYQNSTSEREG